MTKVVKSEKPEHIYKAKILRECRKSAGFTQVELANKLSVGISTVQAIENRYAETIGSLEEELLESWWLVCQPRVSYETQLNFKLFTEQRYKFISSDTDTREND